MSFTDADLERAATLWSYYGPSTQDVAQLIADIRSETIERCAVHLEQERTTEVPVLQHLADHLRALKDGGK